MPRRPPANSGAALVGRDAELTSLGAALAEADAGRGRAVFVVGESGIGKTQLVSALAEQATQRGFTVAIGRAYPVESGVPYAVFADAFVPLLNAIEPSVLSLVTRGATSELAQLFPALDLQGAQSVAPRGDPSELKARLLWNFAQFLSRFAARRPLVVVLENLQWADSASLEMLHFVARQIASARVLIIGTHNDPDHRTNAVLRTTEHSLRQSHTIDRIRLAPLSADAIAELLTLRFRVNGDETRGFAERLHRWTGGNALFVGESIDALVESGRLRESNGRWVGWDVETLGVAPTIREAVLGRVADLSADARRVADVAAALGTRATHEELLALTELSADAMIAAIDELRRADVLTEREDANDIVYDFSHPLIQETLYAELGLARARAMHGAIARTLEEFYGSSAMAHAGELAFHYARGDTRRVAAKAVQYLRAAGRDASAKYANREAADYLSAAFEIAEQDDASQIESLAIDLAQVRQRLGDYDGATALWVRALELARAREGWNAVASVERSLGLAKYWTGAFDDALRHYDAAIDAARRADDRLLQARVLVARASCLQAIGRTIESRGEIEAALALAEQVNDPGVLARVHRALLLFYVWTGPREKAREHGAHAIALAEQSNQRSVAWSAHWALAMLGGLTGNVAEIARHLAEAQRIADEAHSPLFRMWASEIEVEYAAGIGDWDRAVAVAERTIELARSLNQRAVLPRTLVWLGLLHLGRGEMEQGKAVIDEAWDISGAGSHDAERRDVFSVVPAHIGRAAYALATQHYGEAVRIGEKGLRIADSSGHTVWAIHRLMPIIAEASLWLSDMDRARGLAERMRRESTALGQQLGLAWADACEALVELLKGDKQRAVDLLRGAAEALEAIPFVPDAARVRRQLALALAETGDRDGAMRELRGAHEVFAHLGAQPELDATREQMRALGARPPSKSLSQGIAGLTGRELEIVRLVAARKSNKEIGAALDISARTASTHLSNIFAKLGVESRGELADRAREEGLLSRSE